MGPTQVSRVRVLTLVFVSCSETDLPGVLCGKAHYDAARPTCPVKYLDINKCPAMNILNLKVECLVGC
jgi:hypothetical protein